LPFQLLDAAFQAADIVLVLISRTIASRTGVHHQPPDKHPEEDMGMVIVSALVAHAAAFVSIQLRM
jgi:hypothetical protein